MILYKYYDENGGAKALQNRQLGFRTPVSFNDPFELSALLHWDRSSEVDREYFCERIEHLKEKVVILCLTRSPLNPLMWAHYGRQHKGFVVGYDVSGEFLNSPSYNLIPADSGAVIYTNTKSPFVASYENLCLLHQVCTSASGVPGALTREQQIVASRLFLTKHVDWAYEEEVRVVKITDNVFEEAHAFQADPLRAFDYLRGGGVLFRQQAPIHSVYLGLRNTWHKQPKGWAVLEELGCRVYQLEMDDLSWQLTPKLIL